MPGGRYPSVTEALGMFADFSGISPEVLAAAADRGTRAHAACEAYIKGLWLPKLDDDIQPFFDSFVPWYDSMVEQVLWCEGRLEHSAYLYSGKPDLVCIIKGDDCPTVIDLKTPIAKGKLWSAQLAAYRELWRDHAGLAEDARIRCASLRIRREPGQRALFDEYRGDDLKRDFNAFRSALNAYRWFAGK